MRSVPRAVPSSRLTLHHLECESGSTNFAADVKAGLSSSPKRLSPRYFYDELGSHLFEAICFLPEYYLTRAEAEILNSSSDEIIGEATGGNGAPVRLIELGSGSAVKTRHLIEASLRLQGDLHYIPIDISAPSLERSCPELLHEYPRLRITAYAAEYFTALRSAAGPGISERSSDYKNVVLFLGSNIGNFEPAESRNFFREMRQSLRPGDVLLIGADLKKAEETLIAAYNDALGVTAAFNLNLLVRINRELKGDFQINNFKHQASYDRVRGCVMMHLASLLEQRVTIREIGIEVAFDQGETIHTENSYKYDLAGLRSLAEDTGFKLERIWLDSKELFSFNLCVAI